MPFDNASTPRLDPVALAALDMLADIRHRLRSEGRWTRNRLFCRRFYGVQAVCLMGALNMADHGNARHRSDINPATGLPILSIPALRLCDAMKAEATARGFRVSKPNVPNSGIVDFNNTLTTRHDDLLDYLDAVKRRLQVNQDSHAL